ncbi:PilZ domain-containing protein [Paenibacillus sp. MZ04-78.2]|uniref:PilZ domain-containing protein n=1 Tax=Paenibacillus sp. MZ04-78.2 TaxID=2962034 RepID=UPI0020B6AECD|nr:PilZ domain-containing protein [Paenibacillus sp. MZ04-78.2]MCP3772305.1 PilZ domain-containing protein [Paenibacillus sp. MZ04-78.2]
MYQNKRSDAFRFSLNTPLVCYFEVTNINGTSTSSTPVKATLMDISNSGCKIVTPLNLNAASNKLQIILHVQLQEELLKLNGSIRWQLQSTNTLNHYGVNFIMNESEKRHLHARLRTLTALRKITVN